MTTLFVDGRVVLVSGVTLEQWVRGLIDRPIEYGEVRPLARGLTNNRNSPTQFSHSRTHSVTFLLSKEFKLSLRTDQP